MIYEENGGKRKMFFFLESEIAMSNKKEMSKSYYLIGIATVDGQSSQSQKAGDYSGNRETDDCKKPEKTNLVQIMPDCS